MRTATIQTEFTTATYGIGRKNHLIESLLFCALSFPFTTEELSNYIECRQETRLIEHVIEWEPLVSKYFKEEDVKKALKIIYCESSGRPNAVGKNTNGTKDVGLWQFNDDTWAWLKDKLKISSDRTNPEVSTAVASWLVYNDGWFHWNSSKKCWKY